MAGKDQSRGSACAWGVSLPLPHASLLSAGGPSLSWVLKLLLFLEKLSHHIASRLSHLPKRVGHHSFYYFFLFIVKPTKTLSCSHQASDRATLDKLTND